MKIGVPKEIKNHEYRVALTPEGAKSLVAQGHQVYVQHNAGAKTGYPDKQYQAAGATVLQTAQEVFAAASLIVKVKEPQPQEYALLDEKHTVFTYLHLAADKALTDQLLHVGCTAIAYETVSADGKTLPLLAPMSIVAGKLATQVGAYYLQTASGGRGILLGGAASAPPGKVLVFGGGMVGSSAVEIAVGMGATVTLVDQSDEALQRALERYPFIHIINSRNTAVDELVADTDLLVGAVLVPGARAPIVVTDAMVKTMHPGSVIVDVAIDQGGCIATSKVTNHDAPVFTRHEVIHYCVSNMPSAAARTATQALTAETLPYIQQLADKNIDDAIRQIGALQRGVNTYRGKLVQEAVAEAQQRESYSLASMLG